MYYLGYQIEKILATNGYYQSRCYTIKESKKLAKQNNFTIKDITSIVHIPTPFNKIAILLSKLGNNNSDRLISSCIRRFAQLGNKKTRFMTGWFIAMKLVKNV